MNSTDTLLWEAAVSELNAANEKLRPSYLYRPHLSLDGNQWCALYGENLQEGVAGFGDSPAAAYADFDRAWSEPTGAPRDHDLCWCGERRDRHGPLSQCPDSPTAWSAHKRFRRAGAPVESEGSR